ENGQSNRTADRVPRTVSRGTTKGWKPEYATTRARTKPLTTMGSRTDPSAGREAWRPAPRPAHSARVSELPVLLKSGRVNHVPIFIHPGKVCSQMSVIYAVIILILQSLQRK